MGLKVVEQNAVDTYLHKGYTLRGVWDDNLEKNVLELESRNRRIQIIDNNNIFVLIVNGNRSTWKTLCHYKRINDEFKRVGEYSVDTNKSEIDIEKLSDDVIVIHKGFSSALYSLSKAKQITLEFAQVSKVKEENGKKFINFAIALPYYEQEKECLLYGTIDEQGEYSDIMETDQGKRYNTNDEEYLSYNGEFSVQTIVRKIERELNETKSTHQEKVKELTKKYSFNE